MGLFDIEAHFYTESYVDYLVSRQIPPRMEPTEGGKLSWFDPSIPDLRLKHGDALFESLLNLGKKRVEVLDAAGIEMAVASLSTPGVEQLEADESVHVARDANDALGEVIREHPGRFIGLASLPCLKPEVAAAELERCVTELGFMGANIHSHIQEHYLDDQRFWVIFETAQRLGVPINLHPTVPHGHMIKPFLGYGWALPGPGLGFGMETAVHAMRLIYAGVFDEYPQLNMILGHLGESLTFWMYRIDFDFTKPWMDKTHRPDIQKLPSQYLRDNFYMTTSGNFLNSALLSVVLEMGTDRLMFASDYPWERLEDAVEFLERAPLSQTDKEKIGHLNARRLFGMPE